MPIGCNKFPVEYGLRYQNLSMIAWQKILKPEVFELVQQEAVRQNKLLPPDATGYDVWRGDDILRFVLNIR